MHGGGEEMGLPEDAFLPSPYLTFNNLEFVLNKRTFLIRLAPVVLWPKNTVTSPSVASGPAGSFPENTAEQQHGLKSLHHHQLDGMLSASSSNLYVPWLFQIYTMWIVLAPMPQDCEH